MGTKIKEVDIIIDKAAPFAQPIMRHYRNLIHDNCPNVEEKIKWGMAFFDYKGPMTHIAAFKAHCAIGFWKALLLEEFSNTLQLEERTAMGHFGKIGGIDEMPSDEILIPIIVEAWRLNEENVKLPAKNKVVKEIDDSVPEELKIALSKAPQAQFNFEKFSPSHKREYSNWIREAKTETTKLKRINTAIEQLNEGKSKDWKYQK